MTILSKWSERQAGQPQVKVAQNKTIQAHGKRRSAGIEIDKTKLKESSRKQGEKAESASAYVRRPIAVADNDISSSSRDGSRSTSVVESRQFSLQQNRKFIIYFDFDSNQLSNAALENLEELAAALIQRPEIKIIIKGFTDQYGIYSYNKMLSASRANVVKGYLIGKSIEPSRIKTIGIGPVESSETNKRARMARRVEIELDTTSPEK